MEETGSQDPPVNKQMCETNFFDQYESSGYVDAGGRLIQRGWTSETCKWVTFSLQLVIETEI